MAITVHNYRPKQFHRTWNGENLSSGYRDKGSANLVAARPAAWTVTTVPLQPGGLRLSFNMWFWMLCTSSVSVTWCLSPSILEETLNPVVLNSLQKTEYICKNDPVTMVILATGHQVRCILRVQVAVFNKGTGFICELKLFAFNIFCGEYLQPSLRLMLQIC